MDRNITSRWCTSRRPTSEAAPSPLFQGQTPQVLLQPPYSLYNALAIPLYGSPEHRKVSLRHVCATWEPCRAMRDCSGGSCSGSATSCRWRGSFAYALQSNPRRTSCNAEFAQTRLIQSRRQSEGSDLEQSRRQSEGSDLEQSRLQSEGAGPEQSTIAPLRAFRPRRRGPRRE
ncbi:hypothetical protein EMIHUDRAFT_317980 [Emiliania huxleyi CCMP1516]|uniref:Uncharacterized protein n=2 Tax=Emiliania huxleyi TaxID=2903 RepID=A0A0D3II96_EMIH1|nr:hypothetical protein EMIHUDRAFT_317980 [Emiliania huxleyi CCMP1516]EOD10981.1 hypothetical protein EMIHUDRAFT_317980 [Emiliania huxleyi CCMP1516]|eukprot:XP_005763410.1 hypothetical protein EMIHUDRAFT_317980 [Emiliania huxleyi CCMP1516]